MKRRLRVSVLGVLAVLACVGVLRAEPSLKVGDPAPPLKVAKWIKGEPVAGFEKGKVYVVECWATWCGPCRASIPHVTAIQKKLGEKVTAIGVAVWENQPEGVEPFVKEMGEKMAYRVALDDQGGGGGEGAVAKTWLRAAGKNGIPCAFVVDQESKIAWIGHPMNGMDEVVEQVIAGKYDTAAAARQEARLTELKEQAQAAEQAGDWDKLLAIMEETMKLRPQLRPQAGASMVVILLRKKHDVAAASKLATKLAEESKDDVRLYPMLGAALLGREGDPERDVALAIRLLSRSAELTENGDLGVLDLLARAYHENGETDKAIATEQAAVDKSDGQIKAFLTKNLEKYKAAKAAKK